MNPNSLTRTFARTLHLILIAGFALGLAPAAHAASFTVDTRGDAVDANPGDGLCATATADCTLRAAVQETNALPGADTIILPAGSYLLSIPGAMEDGAATGDLDITDDLTVTGGGFAQTAINGGGRVTGDRVFHIPGSAVVTIWGVTIGHGSTGNGGGIRNSGTLTLEDSRLIGNEATSSGYLSGNGGGIENSGTLTVNHSTISGNTAKGGGAGFYNSGTLTVNHSTFSDNSGEYGGGLYNREGTLTLSQSTLSGNSAIDGGGIFNDLEGTVTSEGIILAGNAASGNGPDCSGSLDSDGYNLVGNNSGCNFNAAAGDLVGTPADPIDPLLGPLQDNGGPTFTHALLDGSPAIDAGNPDECPPTDQRGHVRPVDGDGDGSAVCDMGAYEKKAP